jgi:uncharacterized UPF0146 family protein
MKKIKPKVIVEISGGMVTDITTNLKQNDIDVYVVDWDNINAGDEVPDSPWDIEYPESDVETKLKKWLSKNKI